MNCNSTLRWFARTAMLLLVLAAFGHKAMAQACDIVVSPPGTPVQFSFTLSPVSGAAQLTRQIVESRINSGLCGPLNQNRKVRIYSDAGLLNFVGNTPLNLDCSDLGTTSYWVTINDGTLPFDPATESLPVEIEISVTDATIPDVVAPNDLTVNTSDDGAGDCTVSVIPGMNIVLVPKTLMGINPGEYTDNCAAGLFVTYSIDNTATPGIEISGVGDDAGVETFEAGSYEITYFVEDASGNIGSALFFLTVLDDETPVITCPADQVVDTDAGLCTASGLPIASAGGDNCDANPAITWTAPGATPASGSGSAGTAVFPKGVTNVTYTYTDAEGNSSNCSFMVTVNDNEDPAITCPSNITRNADAMCQYVVVAGDNADATASDNCLLSSLTVSDPGALFGVTTIVGEAFPLGTTIVEWTAEDGEGNTSTCSMSIKVIDVTAPVVAAWAPVYGPLNVSLGECSQVVTFTRPDLVGPTPAVSDNCSAPGALMLTEGTPFQVRAVGDTLFLPGLLAGAPAFNPAVAAGSATVQFPVGTTYIPYTWKDAVNNSVTRYITVTVLENELPVAKCTNAIVTLPLAANGTATLTPAMINNGSTDNCGSITLSVAPASFDCSHVAALQTVTLTVTDAAGNTATCSANMKVDVVDNLAPQVQCPIASTVSVGANCLAPASSIPGLVLTPIPVANSLTAPGQYKDNCGVTSITYTLGGATTAATTAYPVSNNFNRGVTTVTYTFRDGENNQAVCSFNVTVVDQVAPVVTNAGPNPLLQAPVAGSTITKNANTGGCLASVSWIAPVWSDNCTGAVTVTTTHAPGTFFFFGATTVTYTATDVSGNIATHTFIVNVVDTQAPNAQCKDITVQLNNAGNVSVPATAIDNNSTDNCFYDYVTTAYAFNCSNVGANNVTLTLIDGSGNTGSCVSVVTVQDNIAPTATCAALPSLSLNAAGTVTLNATTINAGSTDNCPAGLTYAISVDGSAFAPSFIFNCSHIGNRTITLRATDASGNSGTCSQVTLIRDVTAPTITAPANVTINCDSPSSPATTGNPTGISDACTANIVPTFTDVTANGICANEYTITRTWQVSDASGNTRTATQTIAVVDDAAPVFNTDAQIVLETDSEVFCDAPLLLQITEDSISDNCTDFIDFTSIQYKIDYPNPSFGYLDVTTFTNGSAIPAAFFPIGTTKVIWRAVDACGNVAFDTVTVLVKDTQAPYFTANNGYDAICNQPTVVLNNTPGACSNLYAWRRPNTLFDDVDDCKLKSVTESISVPAVTSGLPPFNYNSNNAFGIFVTGQFPVGITTVTYTAVDSSGNSSICDFVVEVRDVQAPQLICPPNQTLLATCPTAQVPNYRNLVLVSDNCSGNVQLTQAFAAGTTLGTVFAPNPPASGNTFTVTISGSDGYNTATCSFNVVLEDGAAPIPAVATLPDIIDSCGTFIIDAPIAFDPCNPAADTIYATPSTPVGMFIPGTPPRYNLMPGSYVITWLYNDGNGNISSQPQNITVLEDIFPPVAQCEAALTIDLDALGKASINTSMIDSLSYDPQMCGPITLSLNRDTFTCANIGVNNIILKVSDAKNQMAQCTTKVTVRDVLPPVLSAIPANITLEACAMIPNPTPVTVTDVCDTNVPVLFTQVSTQDTAGVGKYNYTITRTWTATDDSGNSATGVRVITIKDTQAPVFAANMPDTLVYSTLPANTNCKRQVNFNVAQYVSDCATGADLRVRTTTSGFSLTDTTELLDLGVHTFIFLAKDTTGNQSFDTLVIEIKDGTKPIAACINGISVALQGSGTAIITPSQVNANSFDNCSPTDSLDLFVQRLQPLGPITGSITFDCADAGATQHPVRLYVRDEAGNEAVCETYVVVQDNVIPTIICPASKTIDCQLSLSPTMNNNGSATFTDNCPGGTVTYVDSVFVGSGAVCEVVERNWKVSDAAGNIATCVQTFNIEDTKPPIFSSLPPDMTIDCDDALVTPPVLTATDNCTPANEIVIVYAELRTDTALGACGQYSYTVQRTWTATDNCNNTNTHTQKIVVTDQHAPEFLGIVEPFVYQSADFPAVTNCAVPVNLDMGQFLFDCTPTNQLVVTHNQTLYAPDSLIIDGIFPVGEYEFIINATDLCGNTASDTITVIVEDNSIPTAICNGSVVVSLGSNATATISAQDIDLGSFDNCGIDTMVVSPSSFDCSDIGLNTVELTVTDVNGNTNSCTVDVEVGLGNNAGISVSTINGQESYLGAGDGSVSVTATGGSGNYSYAWSSGATTATATNLMPGIYTVTVTDVASNCQAIGTATVSAGLKLTLNVGNGSGIQGQMIEVPVTAERFNKIHAFSLNTQVLNPAVGVVGNITNPNALLTATGTFTVSPSGTGLTWLKNPLAQPLSLPSGTVLFTIKVTLGNAPNGSTSPLQIVGGLPPIDFLQDSAGTPVTRPVDIQNGTVTIANNDLKLAGDIMTWRTPVKPVKNVNVTLGGTVAATQVTGAPGTYEFSVPPASNTVVSCTKTTAGANGMSSADLLLIQYQIFGTPLFPSPYQWVAADVTGDRKITLADYLIIQRVVLGTDQHLLNSPDWKFVPKSYTFPLNSAAPNPAPNGPFGPLSVPFPQTIERNNVLQSFLDDDFVAVRMGDVNGNVSVDSLTSSPVEDRSNNTFVFRLEEQSFDAGDEVVVPFRAGDFRQRQAYQTTISFDPEVFKLEDIQAGALPGLTAENFGTAYLSEGHLSTVWTSHIPVSLPDNEVLFTLKFRAQESGSALSPFLAPTSAVTNAEAMDRDGSTMPVDFEFINRLGVNNNEGFALYQNQPNPFNEGSVIGFRLPEDSRATLRVFNVSGQLVRTVTGQFNQGYNSITLRRADLSGAGVYYYELETARFSDRKKMILID